MRQHLPVVFALFAWIAQLCLPMVHATVMAEARMGGTTWCGTGSSALQAELAKLPRDIRQILDPGTSHADRHPGCIQLCASSAGAATLPELVTVAWRATRLEDLPSPVAPPAKRARAFVPPARGPPPFF